MRVKHLALLSLALLATIVLAQEGYPIEITKIETKDLTGVAKTTFTRGEMVVVETELYGTPEAYYFPPEGVSYLEIIELFYGARAIGLTLTRDTIKAGETKIFGGGIPIRLTDPTGTYTVEVYVWNGFPSEMGANWRALAEMGTTTITVTP